MNLPTLVLLNVFNAAAWTFGGTVTAPLIARLHRRGRSDTTAQPPICGCEHHLAQHDPITGECHQIIVFRASNNHHVRCTCRRYVGPIPPELVIAQPLGYTEPGLVALRPPEPEETERRR